MILQSESRIQQSIFMWYHNTYCLPHHTPQDCIYHIPNQNQQHLTSIGVKAGVPDLQVIVIPTEAQRVYGFGPKFIYFEVKDHKGLQSQKQKEFKQWCIKSGIEYHLVRSLDEFKQKIKAIKSGS